MRCHAAGVCSFSFNPLPTRHHRRRHCLSAPPAAHFLTRRAILHLRFTPLLHPRAQAPHPLSPPLSPTRHLEPPPVPSKPDRPTLIDLLISTIVLYLRALPRPFLALPLPRHENRGERDTRSYGRLLHFLFYSFETFRVAATLVAPQFTVALAVLSSYRGFRYSRTTCCHGRLKIRIGRN